MFLNQRDIDVIFLVCGGSWTFTVRRPRQKRRSTHIKQITTEKNVVCAVIYEKNLKLFKIRNSAFVNYISFSPKIKYFSKCRCWNTCKWIQIEFWGWLDGRKNEKRKTPTYIFKTADDFYFGWLNFDDFYTVWNYINFINID